MKQDALHHYAINPGDAGTAGGRVQPALSYSSVNYSLQPIPDRNWFESSLPSSTDNTSQRLVDGIYASGNTAQNEFITTTVIKDMAGFMALKVEWNELLKKTPVNSLFLSWEWLITWWKNLAEDRKLQIITVRFNNKLIAIAPLCVCTGRPGLILPVRTFEFLGVGNVGSDYPDLIIDPDKEQAALQALMTYILSRNNILRLSLVLKNSCYLSKLARLLTQHGWHIVNRTTHVCPFITLSGHDWDTYLASLGSSHRYNFRRRLKNLRKQFTNVEFEQIISEQQLETTLPKLIELHNLRWDKQGGSDAFHRPELLRFHDDISKITLKKGSLRLFQLRLDGKVVAVLYGFKYNNILYFYQSGYDLEYSRYSVGLVIMGLAIKSSIEEGMGKYDFLHGDEEYKYLWTSQEHELEQLIFVPPGFVGSLYLQALSVRKYIKNLAFKYLPGPVFNRIVSGK